jgi:hypothetical protein
MPATAPPFTSLADQLANVRRWNEDRGWDIPESEMEAVDLTEVSHASPLVVDLIAVYLPGDAERKMNGVQRTCADLWDIAASRQPNSWCWDERRDDGVKPVRLLAGMGHELGVRRVTLDLAAHWDRHRGARPLDVRSAASASAEVLAAAAHFPDWVRAMDGERVPFVCLAGYQVTLPSYEVWRHVVCLSWSHINRRINLSDNWADYYQDRFASPVLVGAPVSALLPPG